jgi:hypothetical protein
MVNYVIWIFGLAITSGKIDLIFACLPNLGAGRDFDI